MARRRASSRIFFVQMVMDRAPLEAADEKIWQSFENLKQVMILVILLETTDDDEESPLRRVGRSRLSYLQELIDEAH